MGRYGISSLVGGLQGGWVLAPSRSHCVCAVLVLGPHPHREGHVRAECDLQACGCGRGIIYIAHICMAEAWFVNRSVCRGTQTNLTIHLLNNAHCRGPRIICINMCLRKLCTLHSLPGGPDPGSATLHPASTLHQLSHIITALNAVALL